MKTDFKDGVSIVSGSRSSKCEPKLSINELIVCLGIAGGVGSGLLTYLFANLTAERPSNDAGYYFLRAAARIDDLLRVQLTSAIVVPQVARGDSWERGQLGQGLAILITTLALAALVFSWLAVFRRRSFYRRFLCAAASVSVFFAAPLAYIVVSFLTWDPSLYTFWKSPVTALLLGEIVGAAVLVAIRRWLPLSLWVFRGLFVIHAAVWVPILWPRIGYSILTKGPSLASWILLAIFPALGILWLISARGIASEDKRIASSNRTVLWMRVAALFVILGSLLLWLPKPGHAISTVGDRENSTIKLIEGRCYGRCPSYELTIHGNGLVEYDGWNFVKVHGYQSRTLAQRDLEQVWLELDRVHFLSLDDRAFRWCFDTGSVSISFTSKNVGNTVSSDDWCVGAKSGVQAKFVEASRQIKKIVDADQWVRCDGYCR